MCNGFDVYNARIVRLSIGGQEFSTTYATVTNGRSNLLTDAFESWRPQDGHEVMFFDNDASAFHIFLNFLRHGKLIVSDIEFDRLGEQLKFDAEFYVSEDFANAIVGKAAEKASSREAADQAIAIEASAQTRQEAMFGEVVTAVAQLQKDTKPSTSIIVSGAGAEKVNGTYHRVEARPSGPYASKHVHYNYHWALEGNPATIIYRETSPNTQPNTWGIAVDGHHYYFGGGVGDKPESMTHTREAVFHDGSFFGNQLPCPSLTAVPGATSPVPIHLVINSFSTEALQSMEAMSRQVVTALDQLQVELKGALT